MLNTTTPLLPITTPFYFDWTFWAFVSSAVAILLSQLPPIRQWFSPGRLSLELPDRVWITHMIGFPNVQVYINLRNIGGRPLRIKKMTIELYRHGKHLCGLKVMNFIANELNPQAVVLNPFTLDANEEWGHRVNALEALVAKEDRHLLRVRRALRDNIREKIRGRREAEAEATELVEADPEALQPIMEIFERNFIWEAGEYEMSFCVDTEQNTEQTVARYRFTVFDPDSVELRMYAEDYKHGFGPAMDYENHAGVVCQLHPV